MILKKKLVKLKFLPKLLDITKKIVFFFGILSILFTALVISFYYSSNMSQKFTLIGFTMKVNDKILDKYMGFNIRKIPNYFEILSNSLLYILFIIYITKWFLLDWKRIKMQPKSWVIDVLTIISIIYLYTQSAFEKFETDVSAIHIFVNFRNFKSTGEESIKQTYKQTHKQTHKQTYKQTNKQTNK